MHVPPTPDHAYFQHLVDYRDGDADGMASYVASSTRHAAEASVETAQHLASLPEQWNEAVGARRGSAPRRLADHLVESPVPDIERVEALTGVSRARPYDAIDRLVDAGVLDEVTGGSRNRVWAAHEVMGELELLEERIGRRSVPGATWMH